MISVLKRCKCAIEFALRNGGRYVVLCAALGLGTAGTAAAQHAGPSAAVMTQEDLGALFDEHAVAEMKKANIAGAAVVVVKDGAVVFARGYGHADVQRGTPVSPTDTLFRVASVSKVVTYTAVMQLVEQGKIDLDSDIARYLDFPIPAAFGKPITMRHLMAHTAGFEETVQGRWIKPGQLTPLRDYLVQQMPRRIFAPGTVPAYSSYGTTLAGYIVERVSGDPFETYIQKHVFAPLGMRDSSFAQPLPPRLGRMLAKGYATGTGPAGPFDTAQIGPATSMSSSPMDMARFMLAHLAYEVSLGPSLLMPQTLAQMHSPQFRHHPAAPAVALGLYEMGEVAPRLIGHVGDIPGFHSGMYLFPEQRVGLFIVQNTETGAEMRTALLKAFAARYLAPAPRATAPLPGASTDESSQISGSYRTSRRFDSSPLSLAFLLQQSVVRVVRPGTLVIDSYVGPDGKPVEWHQIGAGVWQNVANPQRRVYFSKNAHGDWEMSSNRDPSAIMQKSPWHQHKYLALTVLPLSLLVVVLSLAGWPMAALLRQRRRAGVALSPQARKVRNRMRLAALVNLAPWLLYGAVSLIVMNDLLFVASPACGILLRSVQLMAWLAVATTMVAICATWAHWRDHEASWTSRLHYTLLSLACLGATAMAWQGGLLIWNGRY